VRSRCASRGSTSPSCRGCLWDACARCCRPSGGGGAARGRAAPRARHRGAAHRRRPRRPPRRAARPGPRLPHAGAQHTLALARRAAAAAPRDAGALQPVRRGVRARRALGGPAPRRHRGAADGRSIGSRPAATPCSWSSTRSTWSAGRLDRGRRPRGAASTAVGCSTAVRPRGWRRGGLADAPRHLFGDQRPARGRFARRAGGCASRASRATTSAARRGLPARVLTSVTGVSGSGKSSLVSQALAELVGAALGHEPEPEEDEAEALEQRAVAPSAGHIVAGLEAISRLVVRGSEAHRTHAALQPRHVHRPVRRTCASSSPPRLWPRSGATTPGASPSTWPRGAATLRGRGLRVRGAAVHAQRLRAVPGLQGRALQPRDARGAPARAEHRRRAGHDRRRGLGVLRRRGAGAPLARRAARGGPRATCAWGSPPPSCRAARPSASSSPPSCSAPLAARRCTSSTSPPPACTRRTSRG
jgi:hypothetical protein